MATTAYSTLYALLRLELPRCPNTIILQGLQKAAREFCRETESWVETLASIDIEEEERFYALTTTFTATIVRIKELRINSENGVTEGLEGAVQNPELYEFAPATLKVELDRSIEPVEDITDALDVKIIIMPTMAATTIEQWFLSRYTESIVAWAFWSLMMMPNKRWTNATRAEFYLHEYNKGINKAGTENLLEYTGRDPGLSA